MRPGPRLTAVLLATALVVGGVRPVAAAERLGAGDVAALVAVPTASVLLGRAVQRSQRPLPPRWVDPPALDLWVASRLAPEPGPDRGNFMDSNLANELNSALMGAAVGWLDGRYPRGDRSDDVLQGQLLYWSGLVTLKGAQAGVKGVVGRQRPLPRLWPEVAAARLDQDPGHDRASFWSGHASGAFYGATFLNLRLRAMLRRELSSDAWADWRWASPAVLYGWAAWVAYSRIHAHQHYLTDVLTGALMGTVFAIVFESLDPQGRGGANAGRDGGGVPLGAVVLRF